VGMIIYVQIFGRPAPQTFGKTKKLHFLKTFVKNRPKLGYI